MVATTIARMAMTTAALYHAPGENLIRKRAGIAGFPANIDPTTAE